MKKRQQKSSLVQKPSSLTLVEIELALKIECIKIFMYQNTIREWILLLLLWHFECLPLSNTRSWTFLCIPIWTWTWNTWMSTFVPCAECSDTQVFPEIGQFSVLLPPAVVPALGWSSPLLALRWKQELLLCERAEVWNVPRAAWKHGNRKFCWGGSLEHTSCGLKTEQAAEDGL